MKKRKIKWVNSYRDIPRWQERGLTSSLHGFHERSTDTVYLIKGKSSKADEQHEIYHGIKKHPDKPHNPYDFIDQEIKATLYAYNKTGQPQHILGQMRGIHNSMIRIYPTSTNRIIDMIGISLKRNNAPVTWLQDFKKAQTEARMALKKGK